LSILVDTLTASLKLRKHLNIRTTEEAEYMFRGNTSHLDRKKPAATMKVEGKTGMANVSPYHAGTGTRAKN